MKTIQWRIQCNEGSLLKCRSNYWTAALYFRAQNGTFKRVQQYANIGLVQRGGMTVYYIPPYDGVSKVTAFKPVRTPSPNPICLLTQLHTTGFPHARRQPHAPQYHR
jgi:hypothetical protein